MFGIVNYSVFIISAIMLNLTPGADTMYIIVLGLNLLRAKLGN